VIHRLASSRLVKLVAAFVGWFEHAGVVAINIEWLSKGSLVVLVMLVVFLVLFSVKEAM
jgi:hypothetical protein